MAATTFDAVGRPIDTTSSMATDALTAAPGCPLFDRHDTPFSDTATVTFTTTGQVPLGGTLTLTMPDLQEGSSVQTVGD